MFYLTQSVYVRIVLLAIELTASSNVGRTPFMEDGTSTFYSSIDRFTNFEEKSSFCSSRNAICDNSPCDVCKCSGLDTETFISYHHGCFDLENAFAVLNGSHCLRHSVNGSVIIPLVKLNDNECKLLYTTDTMESLNGYECSAKSVHKLNQSNGSFDVLLGNGKQEQVEIENSIGSKCIRFKSLQGLESTLGKVDIICTNQNVYIDTCFIFKVEGAINIIPITTTPTSKTTAIPTSKTTAIPTSKTTAILTLKTTTVGTSSGGGNNIIIGIVIAIVILIVIILTILLLIYRRKRNSKSSEPRENKNAVNAVNGNVDDSQKDQIHYQGLDGINMNRLSAIEYAAPIKPKDEADDDLYSYVREKEVDTRVQKVDNPYYIHRERKKNRDSKSENPIYGDSNYVELNEKVPCDTEIYSETKEIKNKERFSYEPMNLPEDQPNTNNINNNSQHSVETNLYHEVK